MDALIHYDALNGWTKRLNGPIIQQPLNHLHQLKMETCNQLPNALWKNGDCHICINTFKMWTQFKLLLQHQNHGYKNNVQKHLWTDLKRL